MAKGKVTGCMESVGMGGPRVQNTVSGPTFVWEHTPKEFTHRRDVEGDKKHGAGGTWKVEGIHIGNKPGNASFSRILKVCAAIAMCSRYSQSGLG